MSLTTAIFACVAVLCCQNAAALDFESVAEGSCNIPNAITTLDLNWFGGVDVWYLVAGNQYSLYRFAAGNPNFPEMREFEFYYDFCPTRTINFTTLTVFGHGFGGSVGNYQVTLPQPGVVMYEIQPPLPGAGQTIQAMITKTDNANYVFMYNCFLQDNQRGWTIFSSTPNLTPYQEQEIENHALSLGLSRRHSVFLEYDSCSNSLAYPNPYPQYGYGYPPQSKYSPSPSYSYSAPVYHNPSY